MAEISLSNPASTDGAYCALRLPAIGRAWATHDEVDCGRSRIEATIGLKGGQLIARHINIIALTPGTNQQEIVRYVLHPEPSGELASNIAQRISEYREEKLSLSALDKSTPDSEHDLVKDIYKLVTNANKELPEERQFSFVGIIVPSTEALVDQVIRKTHAEHIPDGLCRVDHSPDARKSASNREVSLTWERLIPSFAAYVADPTLLDCKYSVRGVCGNTEYSNLVTIHPKHRQALIKAGKYSLGHEECYEFKVGCREGFSTSPHSEQELISELLIQAWNALEVIQYNGPKSAHERFSTQEQDEQLYNGIVDSAIAEQQYVLPSGAQVSLGVGTGVVTFSIQASESEHAVRRSWVITADGNWSRRAIEPDKDESLRMLRAIVPTFAEGSIPEIVHQLKQLHELKLKKQVIRGANLSFVMGDDLVEHLEQLSRCDARVVEPIGDRNIIDLLDGIQTVEFSFKDPQHNRQRPQDPDRMRLGFGPNEELRISLFNSFTNSLEADVPAAVIEERWGRSALAREVLDIFNKQTEQAFNTLREMVEKFARTSGPFGFHPFRARPKSEQIPSVLSVHDTLAYYRVAEVAKIYQVATDAPLAELSVHNFPKKGSVMKARCDFGKDIIAELFVHTAAEVIFQIDLQTRKTEDTKAWEREVFILERPLLLPTQQEKRQEREQISLALNSGKPRKDGPIPLLEIEEKVSEQALTELFKIFHTMLQDEPGTNSSSTVSLEHTRAYQLLKTLEETRA